ncbi:MAG TPA: rhomboid family intramembrane serine protease [Terriglobales bacterium]
MAKCKSCGRDIGFSFGRRLCRWCVQHEAIQSGRQDEEYQRVMPTPWKKTEAFGGSFNNLFIAINVLVFAAMVMKGGSLSGGSGQQLIDWGSNFGPYTLGGQPWRLITYMFLHGGILHIGMNMWCLWQLGQLAESLYGDWLYALLYLLAGIGGGLASILWHPFTNTVGASGAVFGVEGALLASLKLGEFSLPRPVISGLLKNIAIFSVYGLVFGAISPQVDNACHIGGFLVGLIIGTLVALVAPDREHVLRRLLICVITLAFLFGGWQLVQRSRGAVVQAYRDSELLEQGFTALSNNAYPSAKKAFTELVTQNPKSADGHLGLALAADGEGNNEEAVREFRQVIALNPQGSGYLGLGLSLNKLKRYDEAIPALQQHQRINGDDYQTEVALAQAYQAKGMTTEAQAAEKKASQLKSTE